MEIIPTENTEVDEIGEKVSQYCLGLPTILRHVLEQVSTKELLGLSLVNKLWKYEARNVMRERGNLVARFSCSGFHQGEECHRLVAFSTDLEKMQVVPLSGIDISVTHSGHSSSDGSLPPPYQVILDRLSWKYFQVRIYDRWDICKHCPTLVLVKRILEEHCGVLEELIVGYGKEEFFPPFFQNLTFPSLKYLTIHPILVSADDILTTNFIKSLVSRAPNLEKLCVDSAIDLSVNILEGSSAVLVPTGTFLHQFHPLLKPICESLIGSIRAHSMAIRTLRSYVDPELLNTFMPRLIGASRTTLKTLSMDFLLAVPLMCYGICLENVTTLEIHMSHSLLDHFEPYILQLPTGLDFTRIFPKLTKVTILDNTKLDLQVDIVGTFIEQGAGILNGALPDRATNIKLMKLSECSSVEEFLPLLAQMFPDVNTVQRKRQQQELSFEFLREHFLGLEQVIESS